MLVSLKDAELRVRFAEAYLIEILDERERAADPHDWDVMLNRAIEELARARVNYNELRERAGGIGLRAAG